MQRDHENRNLWRLSADFPCGIQAVHFGHLEIEYDYVGRGLLGSFDRFQAVGCRCEAVALAANQVKGATYSGKINTNGGLAITFKVSSDGKNVVKMKVPQPPIFCQGGGPPPPQKPVVKKVPKPVPRRQELPQPTQTYFPSLPPQLPAAPAPSAPPQTAMAATPVPAPVPSPEASAGYRALLSAWLESHKRYPDAARQRGEEGRAVLRFSVDRSGRVLDFAVTSSSGYPDLDQSVEEMMRSATLPPFPAGMPQREMQVSVTIRFSLRR